MARRASYRNRFYRRRAQDGTPDTVTRELTILPNGTILAAITAEESADPEGVHPGLELAGEGVWERYCDKSPDDLGLPYPVLSYQADGSVCPAVENFQRTLAAAEAGDSVAQKVLEYLACDPVPADPMEAA